MQVVNFKKSRILDYVVSTTMKRLLEGFYAWPLNNFFIYGTRESFLRNINQGFVDLICMQTLLNKNMLSNIWLHCIVSHDVFLLAILALAFSYCTFSSRNKKSSNDVANSLHIAPEITILCKVQKHTVPFHMFLPVRLGLYPFFVLTETSRRDFQQQMNYWYLRFI